MQFNIDLSPQISDQLAQAARMRGIDPIALLESLVTEYLPVAAISESEPPRLRFITAQERIAAMDAVAEKYADAPSLPDSAFDRGDIYEDSL